METKVPLSVIILTKNESGRILDCIQSVQWADEVLVVDDESTDNTVQVAESMGAKVMRRKMDIEGRHRNWAHGQAKHEWILSLDADERVTPELAEEIRTLFQGAPAHQTYAIPRRNHVGSRWIRYGGWYPSAQLKLFHRGAFRWEETTVHPRALSESSCGILHHDLIHYTYRDLTDFVGKMNRHTSLEAEKWWMDGRRITWLKALRRAVDRFFRAYLGKQGFREGFLGFTLAALGSWYQLISYAKYVEMAKQTPQEL